MLNFVKVNVYVACDGFMPKIQKETLSIFTGRNRTLKKVGKS